MRTHLAKTEKEISDEVKAIKVETAYYRKYIRNMVGDYIKVGGLEWTKSTTENRLIIKT